MPFPTAVIFLLVLCATALAALCVVAGLSLFAVPKYRAVAPYITLAYPATYLGTVVGIALAWRLNAFVNARYHPESLGAIALIFLTCFVGGAAAGGFLGYAVAGRIAKHFPKTS
jgi:hypothetical protein